MNPMDTAPRDGTTVTLTKKPNPSRPGRKYNQFTGAWAGHYWRGRTVDKPYCSEYLFDNQLEGWEP